MPVTYFISANYLIQLLTSNTSFPHQHTEIKSYNYQGVITDRTSGVLITRHDAYTIEHARRALQGRGYAMSEIRGCEKVEVYCNLPLYRPRYGDNL